MKMELVTVKAMATNEFRGNESELKNREQCNELKFQPKKNLIHSPKCCFVQLFLSGDNEYDENNEVDLRLLLGFYNVWYK